MGGAADLPQRSSSPLKRPASDLEAEEPSNQKDDVDMIRVPSVEPTVQTEEPTQSAPTRDSSVDMLQNEEPEPSDKEGSKSVVASEAVESPTPPKSPASAIPPIDAQIKTVTTFCEAAAQTPLNEGDKVYLVSKHWLERVQSRGSEARKNSKREPEGEIGPVDNSDIVQQILRDATGTDFVQLKPGMGLDNFTVFPEEAWQLVIEWYGLMPGSLPIVRYAHNTSPDKTSLPNIQYEFHPPVFKVHRLHSDVSGIIIPQKLKVSNPPAPVFVFSRSAKYHDLVKAVKTGTRIELSRKVRVWRVPRLQPAAEPAVSTATAATPPSSRPSSPSTGGIVQIVARAPQDTWTQLFLDLPSFNQLARQTERELVDFPDHTANPNYNGSMSIGVAGLGEDQTIVLDESISGNADAFVSNYVPKTVKSTANTNRSLAPTNSQTNSGRTSPSPSGPMTRGRTQKSSKPQGAVGLSNLGNTCYMNSALQCIRGVEELTKYFLSGACNEEFNTDNPLGNNGDVAKAYQNLLLEIYRDNPPNSVTPRNFKNTIGRYAPSFSGYGQQDSQEFLGFLLDGLQEDLSRVKKKPYIEKPDSTDEMVNDPKAIREMAAKVWDITKQRDDSVIADLFTGMYKSTLVCPECSKVSITFDPFNNLTLQLPIENAWSHRVKFYPLNDKPVIIVVDIDKNASIATMKQFISSRVNVPVERLFSAEVFKSKFYKMHDDMKAASDEISTNDEASVYELEAKPTNWPAPKKPKKPKKSTFSYNNNNDSDEDEVPQWDDPMADKMAVPVFHRRPSIQGNNHNRFRKPWIMDAVPHFIMLNRDEAKSEDMIKRKILEKVATLSTHPSFEEEYDMDRSVADSNDPDLVITTGSDADSSGDSKVVASSIDGEDDVVDVVMQEPSSKTSPAGFNTRRPKFVSPKTFLEPQFQNMFSVGFFSTPKELLPTGWLVVDEEKPFPNISTRVPQQPEAEDEVRSEAHSSNGLHRSDSGDEDDFPSNGDMATTRMAEESDEDEAVPPPVAKALPLRSAGVKSGVRVGAFKRRSPTLKTYSKKGLQSARKSRESSSASSTESEPADQGPLVRLGEALVVDWEAGAWDAMFCKDGPDDSNRGAPTFEHLPTFDDPELTAKRLARTQRRKHGITLDDCLDEFGKEEVLSEMDTWYCPRCKEHRRATKKFELWKTPDILIMHLKRFSSSGMRRDKLDVLVDFPIEGLDLSSRVIETDDGKNEIYDLFAVDDHWGGLGGGHYTAFAKNYIDNEWWEYNDSSASKQRDTSRIVSTSAYLLFYRRRSDGPLGGPKIQQIVHDYDNQRERSEDESSESGEGQSLVANTSLRGSPSALTGVGAARRQPNLGSGEGTMTINPSALEKLPAYEAHDQEELLLGDAAMNDGGLRASVEDEGIEMSYNESSHVNIHQPTWNFSSLEDINNNMRGAAMVSGTASDVASDDVQHNSSASEGSIRGRIEDFDHSIAEDEDGRPFVDESPVPDLDEMGQANAIALQADLYETLPQGQYPEYLQHQFDVTGEDEHFEVEEPVAEIHVKDTDDMKMD